MNAPCPRNSGLSTSPGHIISLPRLLDQSGIPGIVVIDGWSSCISPFGRLGGWALEPRAPRERERIVVVTSQEYIDDCIGVCTPAFPCAGSTAPNLPKRALRMTTAGVHKWTVKSVLVVHCRSGQYHRGPSSSTPTPRSRQWRARKYWGANVYANHCNAPRSFSGVVSLFIPSDLPPACEPL